MIFALDLPLPVREYYTSDVPHDCPKRNHTDRRPNFKEGDYEFDEKSYRNFG